MEKVDGRAEARRGRKERVGGTDEEREKGEGREGRGEGGGGEGERRGGGRDPRRDDGRRGGTPPILCAYLFCPGI